MRYSFIGLTSLVNKPHADGDQLKPFFVRTSSWSHIQNGTWEYHYKKNTLLVQHPSCTNQKKPDSLYFWLILVILLRWEIEWPSKSLPLTQHPNLLTSIDLLQQFVSRFFKYQKDKPSYHGADGVISDWVPWVTLRRIVQMVDSFEASWVQSSCDPEIFVWIWRIHQKSNGGHIYKIRDWKTSQWIQQEWATQQWWWPTIVYHCVNIAMALETTIPQ